MKDKIAYSSFLLVLVAAAIFTILASSSNPSDAKYRITDLRETIYYVDDYEIVEEGILFTSRYERHWTTWTKTDCNIILSDYIIKELDVREDLN